MACHLGEEANREARRQLLLHLSPHLSLSRCSSLLVSMSASSRLISNAFVLSSLLLLPLLLLPLLLLLTLGVGNGFGFEVVDVVIKSNIIQTHPPTSKQLTTTTTTTTNNNNNNNNNKSQST
mmetsp:Transcript_21194/g.58981  ORF Transcript_21194/g.58981 Transcript_21194/m.58981 type:complete len:122 (+) Transcript_21194:118-483(+)